MLRHPLESDVPLLARGEFLGTDKDVWGQIAAVELYPGSVPTFTFRSESGHLFAYLPANAFALTCSPILRDIDDFVDIECPASSPSVSVLNVAGGGWGKIGHRVVAWSRYLCSIDWENENLLLHCVILSDGSLAFLRNSRFQIGGCDWSPPQWKKLRNEWHLRKRAACVIIERDGLFLAVSRKTNLSSFGLPAGAIEDNESPMQAAARELKEETGLDAVSMQLLDRREWRETDIYCYLATAVDEPIDTESLRLRGEGLAKWAATEELFAGDFGEYNRAVFQQYAIGGGNGNS